MTCHCIVKHAITDEDRRHVRSRLDGARATGDTGFIMVYLAMLGRCPSSEIGRKV